MSRNTSREGRSTSVIVTIKDPGIREAVKSFFGASVANEPSRGITIVTEGDQILLEASAVAARESLQAILGMARDAYREKCEISSR